MSIAPSLPLSAAFECNQYGIDELFAKYAEVGFLYPEKMELLRPHLGQIKHNWRQLLSGDSLQWVLTNRTAANFASIAVCRHANRSMIAQHLVSDGNPHLSLELMAEAQRLFASFQGADGVDAAQNWFRPNNRYAYRIFASMIGKLGPEKASLLTFEYLQHDLSVIPTDRTPHFRAKEVRATDNELSLFVGEQLNKVFCRGEELTGTDDVTLERLGDRYHALGLRKGRRIVKLVDPADGRIVACVIANRAPLGQNFSFLENRAYCVVDRGLGALVRRRVVSELGEAVRGFYADFALEAIPIVTDRLTADTLEQAGARHLRTYMQSIWLRAGFEEWGGAYRGLSGADQRAGPRVRKRG